MKPFVLAMTAVLFMAPGAIAQQRGYAAVPATAADGTSVITRNTVWRCDGGVCAASKASGSPLTMCQLIAHKVGALSSFTANGQAFDPSALERCNTRAK